MSHPPVSIAEGKKNLSRLIRDAAAAKQDIVLTKRGKPVAVIVPYEAYCDSKKAAAFNRIMESRAAYGRAGLKAEAVIEESREGLRRRP